MRMNRLAAVLLIAGSTLTALAGPPMVCHEVIIGEARSLPWDGGHGGSKRSYDTKNLVRDTIKILDGEDSAVVRMETLRRATIYITHEKEAAAPLRAWELLATLIDRALEGEAAGQGGPGAWFDAGYLIGCYNQVGLDIGQSMGVAEGIPGYRYVLEGIERSKSAKDTPPARIAELEFGAALITHPAMRARGRAVREGDRDVYDAHIARAIAAAPQGSVLEVNLAAHLRQWGTSIETARAAGKP